MPTFIRVRTPSYRRHKPSGQAVVTLNGHDFYLGNHNTPASRARYQQVIAEWNARGRTLAKSSDLSVVELIAAFLQHANRYYVKPDGRPTSELGNFRSIIRRVKKLYGTALVADFGPLALKAVRQGMVADGLSRTGINHAINRLRQIFKWSVENEMVAPTVLHGLQAVGGLRYGRTDAHESEPVRPVPDAFVDAVLPHAAPPVRAMIELQRLTGMRSGEVTAIRACDLDASGKVWTYKPPQHKNKFRGFERVVYLGPEAQRILKPWLTTDLQAYLFRPADSVTAWLEKRHRARRTPLHYGNRPGSNRKREPRRTPSDRYDTASYRRAIKYAVAAENKARLRAAKAAGIDAAKVSFVPDWHPHQLRHNRATELRRQYGLEVARVLLGHKTALVTEIYAEADRARAIEVAAQCG
jgi:integrase